MAHRLAEDVKAFIAEFCGYRRELISPKTTLFGDIGVDGDDGRELLIEFGKRFNVDIQEFDLSRHFGPEGMVPWAPLSWLILLLRSGTPEEKARLQPISVGDLIHAAEKGKWTHV